MNDLERYFRSEYQDADYQLYRVATEARPPKSAPRPEKPQAPSSRSGFTSRLEKAFLQIRFSLYLRP